MDDNWVFEKAEYWDCCLVVHLDYQLVANWAHWLVVYSVHRSVENWVVCLGENSVEKLVCKTVAYLVLLRAEHLVAWSAFQKAGNLVGSRAACLVLPKAVHWASTLAECLVY